MKLGLKTYFIDPKAYSSDVLLDYVTKNISAKINYGALDIFFLPDENSIDLKINKKRNEYILSGRIMDAKDFQRVGWKEFKNFVYPLMRINVLAKPNEESFELEAKIETNLNYGYVNHKARYLIKALLGYGMY
ncbi:hypothetical protein HN385_05660 [archaeon]|jgi:hypothetical protein|nr:hypothetical protein [archaeon]MBT3451468.1 hypothetical protein [archaeon]MBT6868538.1 hypothetical protein [archaeon]MBT7193072.1 hypothetical protein [archaeon]MBT7381161.1 hypothetical protein [archaeon]